MYRKKQMSFQRTKDFLIHKKTILTGLVVAAFFCPILLTTNIRNGKGTEYPVQAQAAEDMLGYKNPEDIVIAMPNKNNYSTTAKKISILGSCDYRYPLFMNGTEIEKTDHGFFTEYVSLSIGTNEFLFQNGEKEYLLTIIRKETSSGGGGGGGQTAPVYKTVKNKMGELIYPYTMPYSAPGEVMIDYLPLTQNTTFRIVGEIGSYYKLPDGTYVLKSSVKVYNFKLPTNEVTKAELSYDEKKHTVESAFTMKIDALYDVIVKDNTVDFVLYDTEKGKIPKIPANPLVTSITVKKDKLGRLVYSYTLTDGDRLCGFDVVTKNGKMQFTLKYAPLLEKKGSLKGAVVLLDAGHGGSDSGTVGAMGTAGPVEKNVNLDIALRTKKALEKMGAEVIMVRETDVFYTLNERVDLIRAKKPDLSVSIHGNAMGITSDFGLSKGFLTYYSYNKLKDAANVLNKSINQGLGSTVRGARKSNLSLTRLTICPAVLLETAFLTNPADYEFLLKESTRQLYADSIAAAAKEYLEGTAVYKEQAFYIVQRGDTLSSIARKNKTTVQKLAELNQIKNVNVIRTGTRLLLPD